LKDRFLSLNAEKRLDLILITDYFGDSFFNGKSADSSACLFDSINTISDSLKLNKYQVVAETMKLLNIILDIAEAFH